ncbi:CHC2 zinc finger domain-containing protein (plasmid) [Atlantibacter subterranea]|uniref:CHC2 zinc finger domain-containing protein n=1 Tax=Atlantibacter subterraneus TaxID=255519 RepID=UPI0020C2B0CB|nr:CHC2 zinc finger domain-containing protein [Atlantibacter subterranea]UTJ49802.1 CHC2 zinc finger domain-containing protein [Atlantibacter subterranea]
MSHLDLQQNKGRAKDDIVGTISRYIKLTKKGDEFVACCPFHEEDTPSFTVTPATGYYYCFGCGEGGDAIDFVSKHEGIGFAEAVNHIVGNYAGETSPVKRQSIKQPKVMDVWEQIVPVPAEAPSPNFTFNRMTATRTWKYRDSNGDRIGYVCRFDKPEGGKEVVPLTYWVNRETGEMKWRYASFSKPRPMYGLDKLASKPDTQVLIVEGEKAADAAQKLFGDRLVVVSWPGGGKAVKFVDWSPLQSRKVGLWPDADAKHYPEKHEKAGELMPFTEQPGTVAMMDIAEALTGVAASVKFIMPPEGVPDGWDLADELPEGFNLMAHAKSAAKTYDEFLSEYAPAPNAEPAREQKVVDTQEPQPAAEPELVEEPETAPPAAEQQAPKVASANNNEPFYPLGYNRGEYFYLVSGTQQITALTATQHSKSNLLQLAPLSYWVENYPSKSGAAWDDAADHLLRRCEARGIFSRDVVRGRGAWIDNGRTVFHFGSHLWVDGQEMATTSIKSRYVYEMDRSLAAPADKALTDAEGRELLKTASMFRWTKPANAALLAGFVALAPLSGALRWRPHIWITGGAGCGKSTALNDYVHPLMGGMDVFAQGNSTEAGIRQRLRCDALPVLFDESEQNSEREVMRVQNVLSLIRQASSESAAKTLKGTASGDAMEFIIRSMFCLSSIQVGINSQADRDRLTILALKPREGNPTTEKDWEALKDRLYSIQRDSELPSRLFRRGLDLLKITQENINTFVDVAATKFGNRREGDQFGTLLAGCWSLSSSELATPEQAKAMIDGYDWEELRENNQVSESNLVLNAILSASLRLDGGGVATVYECVCRAAGRSVDGVEMAVSYAKKALSHANIRVEGNEIWLANNSTQIPKLLAGTPYGADWRGQLKRVEHVTTSKNPKKFNGVNSQYVIVPISLLDDTPGQDHDESPI